MMVRELMTTRRSIRQFTQQAVTPGQQELLLQSALLAPSSKSQRPWEFIAVTDQQLLVRLSRCRPQGAQFLAGAPLAIAVLADAAVSDVWVEDAAIAATFIQLAAHSMGLGSCWIQVRNRLYTDSQTAGDYIKQQLRIPEQLSVACLLAVGYPAESKQLCAGRQECWQNKLHENVYGKPMPHDC